MVCSEKIDEKIEINSITKDLAKKFNAAKNIYNNKICLSPNLVYKVFSNEKSLIL